MKLERCAVLGAGAGGHVMAADLALAGIEVNLYEMPQFSNNLEPIMKRGGIELKGKGRQGFAKLGKVTTDIEQAIKDVKYLLATTQAIGHEMLAQQCAQYLKDGQVIVLFPGSGGSLQVAKTLKGLGVNKKVLIGETVTLPYGCRLTGPAEAEVLFVVGPRHPLAAFPAKDTEEIINGLKGIYPALCPATNVLEAGLLNPNIVKHPMVLFSLSRVESIKEKFCLNRQGMTPSVWKVFNQVDAEKMAILKKLGLKAKSFMEIFADIVSLSYEEFVTVTPEFFVTTKHRYFAEDVPIGLVLLSSLGRMVGVDTPTIDSIIRLVSVINETDCYKQGRTVEKLGIAGMNVKTLNRFLAEGK